MRKSFRLRHLPSAILNQLSHLGPVGMTLRGTGITVFRKVGFGGFFDVGSGGRRILCDPVSGLRVDIASMAGAYAVPLEDGHQYAITFNFEGWPGALSLLPDPGDNVAALGRIVSTFAEEKIAVGETADWGIGEWLDEWMHEDPVRPDVTGEFADEIFNALVGAAKIEVVVRGPGLESVALISPGLVDRDGSVLRVASRGAGEVAFIDLRSSSNAFVEENGMVRIICRTAVRDTRLRQHTVKVAGPSPAETPC